jgi:hypothetical protein
MFAKSKLLTLVIFSVLLLALGAAGAHAFRSGGLSHDNQACGCHAAGESCSDREGGASGEIVGTCFDCDGAGSRSCGFCGGDGIYQGRQCSFCNGRGRIKCFKCGGTGVSQGRGEL